MAAKPIKKTDREKAWNRPKKKRGVDTRPLRKYYLIVCEGEKTEPNYFEGLKEDLPPHVLQTCEVKVEGTGYNTTSLLHKAFDLKVKLEKDRMRAIDKLWVVFDRDSFDPQDFNATIEACMQAHPEIGCAWSNEAFELWYLLHFHFQNTGIGRKQYWPLITERLTPHLGKDFQYRKGDERMYRYLKDHGNQRQAIAWARELASAHGDSRDYANHNPRTEVYRLVEELMQLIPDQET